MSSLPSASDTIRCFIAVELPREVRDALHETGRALVRDVRAARWVKPDSMHLTLKFLGDTPAEIIPDISHAMQDAASQTGSFELATDALGAFPNPRKARVLWAGLSGGTDTCSALHQRIETAMARLGFTRETRPFRAHLTLARFRDPALVPQSILDSPVPHIRFPVKRVVLFQSELDPRGAIYTPLATAPLD
jgi:2'-5' RNA ligase